MQFTRIVRRSLNKVGYDIVRSPAKSLARPSAERPYIDLLEVLVDRLIDRSAELRFLQVGAHDGQSYDPLSHILRRPVVSGVFVEPQPRAFAMLRDAYSAASGFSFENVAISGVDGEIEFYMLRDEAPELPVWLHQSAGLDKAVLSGALKYFRDSQGVDAIPADHESLIAARRVPTMTWGTLLDKHGITNLDLLVLDTMGYDCKLLALFPFDRLKPRIIHFEHQIADRDDLQDCLDLLEQKGYGLAKVAVDTIACLDVPVRRWPVIGW